MPVSAYPKAGLFVVAAAAALFAAAGTVAIPGFWAYLAIFAIGGDGADLGDLLVRGDLLENIKD